MPMYEYQCAACGHRLEAIQKFSDKPLKSCPKCKKAKLEKLLSRSAIQFKGSGWYITDYAKKSSPDNVKAEGDGGAVESKSEAAGDTSGEASSQTSGKTGSEGKKDSSGDSGSAAKDSAKPAAKSDSGKGSSAKAASGKK